MRSAPSVSGATVGQALDRALPTASALRSLTLDHGTEFTSRALEDWAFARGVQLDGGGGGGGGWSWSWSWVTDYFYTPLYAPEREFYGGGGAWTDTPHLPDPGTEPNGNATNMTPAIIEGVTTVVTAVSTGGTGPVVLTIAKNTGKAVVKQAVQQVAKNNNPFGRKGSPMANPAYQPVRNNAGQVGGRNYAGHAFDQMENRGIPPTVVESAIRNNTPVPSGGESDLH